MNPSRLASLPEHGWSFDLETHLIQPRLLAPPPVCGSIGWLEGASVAGCIVTADEAYHEFVAALEDPDRVIVGQNIAFDFLVMAVYGLKHYGRDLMPLIFAAYRAERVFDIGIAEMLHAIGIGSLGVDPDTGQKLTDPETGARAWYRLSVIVWLVLGRKNAKANDRFRQSYALLEHIPIPLWPLEARTYPVDDAINTFEAALAQIGYLPRAGTHAWIAGVHGAECRRCGNRDTYSLTCFYREPSVNLHDLARQCRAAWVLHLGAAWGYDVDPERVAALERSVELLDANGQPTERAIERRRFVEAGIIRGDNVKGKKPGSEDQAELKRRVAIAYGATAPCPACTGTGKVKSERTGNPVQCKECSATGFNLEAVDVPETDTGGVGRGRDVLSESGDETLMDYSHYTEGAKVESTYLPWLRLGAPLFPNVLVETGRSSYMGCAMTLPREGDVRPCLRAHHGRVLSTTDYEAGELITHAQSCLWIVGHSVLAEQLVAKKKPHNAFAARVLGISYEEFNRRYDEKDKRCADIRQAAKPANFGFPGRMGAWKLVLQQRKQGPDTPHPSGPRVLWRDANGAEVRGYKGLRFCILMGEAQRCGEVKITEYKKRTGPPTCAACIRAAERLRADWLNTYTENSRYFDFVKAMDDAGTPVVQHVTLRIRAGAEGNAIANGYFQGLLADAAKDAMYEVGEACFTPGHALFGSRLIHFQHDENFVSHPAEFGHEGATAVGVIMEDKLREYCPDLAPAVRAEPALMLRMYKGASPKRDANGRLVPWEPAPKKVVHA